MFVTDADGDGFISREEMGAFKKCSENEFQGFLAAADNNADGKVIALSWWLAGGYCHQPAPCQLTDSIDSDVKRRVRGLLLRAGY